MKEEKSMNNYFVRPDALQEELKSTSEKKELVTEVVETKTTEVATVILENNTGVQFFG